MRVENEKDTSNKMPATLTEAQNRCFNFIVKYVAEYRRPPSVREIAKALGYASTNAVAQTLDALEAKGYIQRGSGARAIEILYRDEFSAFSNGLAEPARPIPVMKLEFVRASLQLVPRGVLHLDTAQLGNGDFFISIADDDGMDKAGILKGDWVVVERRPIHESEKGVTVGVADKDTFIVRRHYVANSRIQLLAANRSYSERFITPSDRTVQILGAVKMILRKFSYNTNALPNTRAL
ncbi:MAG: hypothetical protein CMR00_03480 [[Chlorobium] sp. 445]|nr:MAG: hypothetical protein CMR00_03480 [[Chlorobium] sp. 445]